MRGVYSLHGGACPPIAHQAVSLATAELLVGMLLNSRFVVATLATFWSAANLMLLLREREARQTHAE